MSLKIRPCNTKGNYKGRTQATQSKYRPRKRAISIISWRCKAFKNLIQKINIYQKSNKSWNEIRKTLSLNKVFETDRYYDLLSAIIKSLRDSSTNEALLYTSTYIHEGGDINQLLRRLIIFASEDIGNATPFALTFSNSV